MSTVCICPLFTFIHAHYLTSTQSMPSLCWPIPVCPQSVVCVHGLYMSTVRCHTHTTLSSTQSMPSLCWSIQVYSCVSTVSVVCPLSVYVHCSLSYTHSRTSTPSMSSLCWPIPVYSCVSTVSGVCPQSVYVHCSFSLTHYFSLTVNAFTLLAHSCVSAVSVCVSTVCCVCPLSVVCVHCQCCVSTVCCVCPLSVLCVHSLLCVSTVSVVCPLSVVCVHCQCCVSTLCSVCPLSVLCVHCLYMSTVYFQSYTISLAHRQRLHCAVPPFEGIFTSYICTKHDWNLTAAIKIIGGCLAVFFGTLCIMYHVQVM